MALDYFLAGLTFHEGESFSMFPSESESRVELLMAFGSLLIVKLV